MSYNNYKPYGSLYQRAPAPMPGHMGQLSGFGPQSQSQYQRRSYSAGALYRAPNSITTSPAFAKSPRFADHGFAPGGSGCGSSAPLGVTASVATGVSSNSSNTRSTSPTSSAATPDRYHRQKHTPNLSTHSLPSLTPSIKSSDLDTSSSQTSTSSISSWTEEKDRIELPQIKESAVERSGASEADIADEAKEPSDSRDVAEVPELKEIAQDDAPTLVSSTPIRNSQSAPALSASITPTRTRTKPPHPSQRTSSQAVDEAIAKLGVSGGQLPSADPVRTHRRQSSADSRTSLVLPSERRFEGIRRSADTVPADLSKEMMNNTPYYKGSRHSSSESLVYPKSRSPVRATRPGTLGSAKTGPAISPIRPPSVNSLRTPSGNNSQSLRPISMYSMSTGPASTTTGAINTPQHSRNSSQHSMSQPIAYAPVRGEPEPKPKLSQKIKGFFRRSSTVSDNASISSNISGRSGLSAMSIRSTSSTFSFRSITQSSKKLFKRGAKIEVDEPTFDQYTPSEPLMAVHTDSVSPSASTGPNLVALPTVAATVTNAVTLPEETTAVTEPKVDSTPALPLEDDSSEVPDTVFPRNLDDVDAVATIRHSVERTVSLDRQGSTRSVRSLHKPNDDEKVPNVQEVRIEAPEGEDDIFGQLDASGLDLTLPKHIRKRGVTFASQVMVYDTFSSFVYDRRPEPATCNHLTPALAQQIKQELNNVKMTMEVHRDSRAYTHFF